jgi:hypothetical protein
LRSSLVYTLVVNAIFSIFYQDPEPLRNTAYYMQVLLGCIAINYVLRTEPTAPRLLHDRNPRRPRRAIRDLCRLRAGARRAGDAALREPEPARLLRLARTRVHPAAGSAYTGYPAIVSALGSAVSVLFVMLSLSKGAILAAFALLFLYLMLAPIHDRRWQRLRPALLIAFPLAVITLAVIYRDQIAMLAPLPTGSPRSARRVTTASRAAATSGLRSWPQYLLFGAGEGLLGRWEYPREIHIDVRTLLFSLRPAGPRDRLRPAGSRLAPQFPGLLHLFRADPALFRRFTSRCGQSMLWTLLISLAHFGPVSGIRSFGLC